MLTMHPPTSFTAEQLADLIAIIKRANRYAEVNCDDLQRSILDLLFAVGTTNDGSEHAIAFGEATANEPTAQELSNGFRMIATSRNPLDSRICNGIWRAKLNAAMLVK